MKFINDLLTWLSCHANNACHYRYNRFKINSLMAKPSISAIISDDSIYNLKLYFLAPRLEGG